MSDEAAFCTIPNTEADKICCANVHNPEFVELRLKSGLGTSMRRGRRRMVTSNMTIASPDEVRKSALGQLDLFAHSGSVSGFSIHISNPAVVQEKFWLH